MLLEEFADVSIIDYDKDFWELKTDYRALFLCRKYDFKYKKLCV